MTAKQPLHPVGVIAEVHSSHASLLVRNNENVTNRTWNTFKTKTETRHDKHLQRSSIRADRLLESSPTPVNLRLYPDIAISAALLSQQMCGRFARITL
jgi:hypothetical protein